MKLRTRLVVYGGVLPTVGMLLATLTGGLLFRRNARAGLDRALLAQAAVESVSLFDGPRGEPHLHLAKSPIGERVRSFAPVAVLYDETRAPVATYPQGYVAPPERAPPLSLNEPVVEDAVDGAGQAVRRLWLRVRAPTGAAYTLSLSAALDSIGDATVDYFRVSFAVLAGMMIVMWLSLSALASNLSRRIGGMMAHLPELERGRFDAVLAPDTTGDELAQLRAALGDATRQLGRARESEERFLANAAHELRTPLSLLRTRLDLSLRKPRTQEELGEALREARADVDRLAQLASKLLDAARPATPVKAPLDLRALVAALVQQWTPLMRERRLTLTSTLPAALTITADRVEVELAVSNLLDNARKFAFEETSVELTLFLHGDVVRVAVKNEGPAIPEQERARIFEPFVRVSTAAPGSGLGLALVHDVARRHGGRAWVEAPSEQETQFILELPAR